MVNRYALATSNDCRESEAIVVMVNECVGECRGGNQDWLDWDECQSQTRPFTSAASHNATKPLSKFIPAENPRRRFGPSSCRRC